MEVIQARARFRRACDEARAAGRAVGLVPTMGALHRGHLALLRRARAESGFVAMTLFVNPLQFGPGEDLEAYPRDRDGDLALARAEAVDAVFAPGLDGMFPRGAPEVGVDPGPLGERLEGASRPGHFRGVCTVVAKLFALAGPCRVYFGEKDAQQVAVIRRMVEDLDIPATVVAVETEREPDGLACSSRNAHLARDERRAATCLWEALFAAARLAEMGERDAGVLRDAMAKRIGAEPLARLDYATVVDERSFDEVERLSGPARALVAAQIGQTRLIDNVRLAWHGGRSA